MKVALCCIAKNEDNYIDEWLDYNIKLGFDDIFVYQNNWRYSGDKSKYKNVKWIEFDGQKMQMPCYNGFLKEYREKYDFAAFFDIDEFLVLKRHDSKTIHQELGHYWDVPVVSVPWRCFGNNGLETVSGDEYSVLKRFVRCRRIFEPLKKCIVNFHKLPEGIEFVDPHYMTKGLEAVDPARTCSAKGSLFPSSVNDTDQPMELFHYMCKSFSEYFDRKTSGDVFYGDDACKKNTEETLRKDFDEWNKNWNDAENTRARDFLYGNPNDKSGCGYVKNGDDVLVNEIRKLNNPIFRANEGNGGDAIIHYGTLCFFDKYGIKVNRLLDSNKDLTDSKDFDLIIGGGGQFVKYYGYQHIIRDYFSKKNLRHCVVLPSSFYECKELLDVLDKRFVVFCRDYCSYEYCIKNNSKARFFVHDDMAFSSDFDKLLSFDKGNISNDGIRKSVERLMRTFLSEKSVILRNDCENRDCLGTTKNDVDIATVPGYASLKVSDDDLCALASGYATAISTCGTMTTNRLHIGIVAAKLGKRVFLHDNSYGKVSSVYYTSMKEFPNVFPMF